MSTSKDMLVSDERMFTYAEVRRILLEIRSGTFYHYNGVASNEAVYLLVIERAFGRKGVSHKTAKQLAKHSKVTG